MTRFSYLCAGVLATNSLMADIQLPDLAKDRLTITTETITTPTTTTTTTKVQCNPTTPLRSQDGLDWPVNERLLWEEEFRLQPDAKRTVRWKDRMESLTLTCSEDGSTLLFEEQKCTKWSVLKHARFGTRYDAKQIDMHSDWTLAIGKSWEVFMLDSRRSVIVTCRSQSDALYKEPILELEENNCHKTTPISTLEHSEVFECLFKCHRDTRCIFWLFDEANQCKNLYESDDIPSQEYLMQPVFLFGNRSKANYGRCQAFRHCHHESPIFDVSKDQWYLPALHQHRTHQHRTLRAEAAFTLLHLEHGNSTTVTHPNGQAVTLTCRMSDNEGFPQWPVLHIDEWPENCTQNSPINRKRGQPVLPYGTTVQLQTFSLLHGEFIDVPFEGRTIRLRCVAKHYDGYHHLIVNDPEKQLCNWATPITHQGMPYDAAQLSVKSHFELQVDMTRNKMAACGDGSLVALKCVYNEGPANKGPELLVERECSRSCTARTPMVDMDLTPMEGMNSKIQWWEKKDPEFTEFAVQASSTVVKRTTEGLVVQLTCNEDASAFILKEVETDNACTQFSDLLTPSNRVYNSNSKGNKSFGNWDNTVVEVGQSTLALDPIDSWGRAMSNFTCKRWESLQPYWEVTESPSSCDGTAVSFDHAERYDLTSFQSTPLTRGRHINVRCRVRVPGVSAYAHRVRLYCVNNKLVKGYPIRECAPLDYNAEDELATLKPSICNVAALDHLERYDLTSVRSNPLNSFRVSEPIVMQCRAGGSVNRMCQDNTLIVIDLIPSFPWEECPPLTLRQ